MSVHPGSSPATWKSSSVRPSGATRSESVPEVPSRESSGSPSGTRYGGKSGAPGAGNQLISTTASTALAPRFNRDCAGFDLAMQSRSPITTEKQGARPTPRRRRPAARRLPSNRPPTHPGEMLLEEFLKQLGISQSAFAVRLGVSFPRLNEVVRGKRSVTPDTTALRLARVLDLPADFWLGLQSDWDLWHAVRGESAAEIARLRPLTTSGEDAGQQRVVLGQ